MSDFAQMKAALMSAVEALEASPRQAVSQAWHQANASLTSLMTGSSSPLVEEIKAVCSETAEESEELEGRTEVVRELVERYIDTAL